MSDLAWSSGELDLDAYLERTGYRGPLERRPRCGNCIAIMSRPSRSKGTGPSAQVSGDYDGPVPGGGAGKIVWLGRGSK